jgi:hypothetical protein
MAEKTVSARTTIILALCTVAVGFYVVIFGLQTVIAFQARHWARRSPFLNAIPQPLPTSAAAEIQEKDLSIYGWEFGAPWKGKAKATPGDATSTIEFPSGEVIIFFNPDEETDLVSKIRGGDPQLYSSYESVFGTGFFPNNFELYAAIYGAAPTEISPFMERGRAVRINMLIIWKLRSGTDGANTIFSVQTSSLRGFQLGDPSLDRAVIVRLFDENDRQIKLLFASKSGQPGTFSQTDINCVLNSLQPVPPQQLR